MFDFENITIDESILSQSDAYYKYLGKTEVYSKKFKEYFLYLIKRGVSLDSLIGAVKSKTYSAISKYGLSLDFSFLAKFLRRSNFIFKRKKHLTPQNELLKILEGIKKTDVVVVKGKAIPKNDVTTTATQTIVPTRTTTIKPPQKNKGFFKNENMPLILGGVVFVGAILFMSLKKK